MKKIINIGILTIITSILFLVGVKAAMTLTASDVNYNDESLQDVLTDFAARIDYCPSDALCSKVSLGDYISMTPTSTTYTVLASDTGYSSDQTITPSELNLWRVIDIRNDGTVEMISEYVSSAGVRFSNKDGYAKFVGTLNTIANQYGNSRYTVSARHIGYNGQTATITDTSKISTSAPWTASTWNNNYEKIGGGDIMYEYDIGSSALGDSNGLVYKTLGTLKAYKVGTTTDTNYWLASRSFSYNSRQGTKENCFTGNIISGGVRVSTVTYCCSTYCYSASVGYAIRPIVTLKSNIINYTGSGTKSSPWVLP